MMLALLAIVAVFVVRWLMRRFGPAAQRPMVTPEGMRFNANETPPALIPAASGSAAAPA